MRNLYYAFGTVVVAAACTFFASHDSAGNEPAGGDVPEWRKVFDAAYGLKGDEIVKFIPPPFIPERDLYCQAEYSAEGETGRWSLLFVLGKDGSRVTQSITSSAGKVDRALAFVGIDRTDMEIDDDLRTTPAHGDWIIRKDADPAKLLAKIGEILGERFGRKLKVERVKVRKDVLVARGTYKFVAQPGTKPRDRRIHLHSETSLPPDDGRGGGGSGDFAELLSVIGERAGMKVIDEATGRKPKEIGFRYHASAPLPAEPEAQEGLMKNVAAQTSLTFTIEQREVEVWRITDEAGSGGL